MRQISHPAIETVDLASVLYALGDPIRLRIVQRLTSGAGEMSCGEAAGDDLPKSTQSFHFKALRDAGIVTTRREGKRYMSQIRPELGQRFPGLLESILKQMA